MDEALRAMFIASFAAIILGAAVIAAGITLLAKSRGKREALAKTPIKLAKTPV